MFDFLKKIISCGKIEGYPVKLIDEFVFSVSEDYRHFNQIGAFLKYANKNHISYTSELSDKNFEHTSYQLEPGEQYHARILRVGKPSQNHGQLIRIYDCISFLEKQNIEYANSYFVGAQGLTYIWQFVNKQNLEPGHPILSMDEIRFIAKNDDRIATLFLGRWHNRVHVSVKFTYDGKWYPGIYLLHVSKINENMKQDLNKSKVRIHNHNEIVYTMSKNNGT